MDVQVPGWADQVALAAALLISSYGGALFVTILAVKFWLLIQIRNVYFSHSSARTVGCHEAAVQVEHLCKVNVLFAFSSVGKNGISCLLFLPPPSRVYVYSSPSISSEMTGVVLLITGSVFDMVSNMGPPYHLKGRGRGGLMTGKSGKDKVPCPRAKKMRGWAGEMGRGWVVKKCTICKGLALKEWDRQTDCGDIE